MEAKTFGSPTRVCACAIALILGACGGGGSGGTTDAGGDAPSVEVVENHVFAAPAPSCSTVDAEGICSVPTASFLPDVPSVKALAAALQDPKGQLYRFDLPDVVHYEHIKTVDGVTTEWAADLTLHTAPYIVGRNEIQRDDKTYRFSTIRMDTEYVYAASDMDSVWFETQAGYITPGAQEAILKLEGVNAVVNADGLSELEGDTWTWEDTIGLLTDWKAAPAKGILHYRGLLYLTGFSSSEGAADVACTVQMAVDAQTGSVTVAPVDYGACVKTQPDSSTSVGAFNLPGPLTLEGSKISVTAAPHESLGTMEVANNKTPFDSGALLITAVEGRMYGNQAQTLVLIGLASDGGSTKGRFQIESARIEP